MRNQVTITFANESDADNFIGFAARSQTQEGTVSGVYAGLACSALKQAPSVKQGKHEAQIVKGVLPVMHSTTDGRDFITLDCPNGWDDVKKYVGKVLKFDGRLYTFTGWNSDRNECFFKHHPAIKFAEVTNIKAPR